MTKNLGWLACASVLWCAVRIASVMAEDITRTFEIRHADARMLAAIISGSAVDDEEITQKWATDVVSQAVGVTPPPRGDWLPEPRWQAFAAILPAAPAPELTESLHRVLQVPNLAHPPVAIPGRNALIVRGPAEEVDRVAELIRLLDQPSDMVNVEVRVEDAPARVLRGWGIDLRAWGDGAEIASTGNAPPNGPTLRWGLGRVAIFGSFPDQESQSTTLTAVNGTTTSGLPIEVAFGQVLPFFTAEIYYDYFGRRRVEYIPNAVFVGTYLWCLPVVVGTGAVKMTLRPSFSYYAGAVTSPRGEVLPIVTYQDVATTVTVPDGESLVIGGLRQVRDEANRRFSGLLRDVRVYESSSPTMIVTPRILRPIAPE